MTLVSLVQTGGGHEEGITPAPAVVGVCVFAPGEGAGFWVGEDPVEVVLGGLEDGWVFGGGVLVEGEVELADCVVIRVVGAFVEFPVVACSDGGEPVGVFWVFGDFSPLVHACVECGVVPLEVVVVFCFVAFFCVLFGGLCLRGRGIVRGWRMF